LVVSRGICYRLLVTSISDSNFGPLVAYLVPGATALTGLTPFSPTLQSWFAATPSDVPNLGGFLYLTVAALATGMTVSAVRWAVIDSIHARTGLTAPPLDFSRLSENVDAYCLLINIHYRHYQFYANMIIAGAVAYSGYRASLGHTLAVGPLDLGFAVLEVIFFMTSRDTLRKYYHRGQQVLSRPRASEKEKTGGLIWLP
jgi:hypothetical protein